MVASELGPPSSRVCNAGHGLAAQFSSRRARADLEAEQSLG
jgi:hypothetical protein